MVIFLASFALFFPLYWMMQRIGRRYFPSNFCDIQKAVKRLSQQLINVVDLERIISLVSETLIDCMKLEKVGILLERREKQIQEFVGFYEKEKISLNRDHFLVRYLEKTQEPVIYKDLFRKIRKSKDFQKRKELIRLKSEMDRREISLSLPLLRGRKLVGFFIFGKKIPDNAYSREDLELLKIIANQLVVIFEKTKLYGEVKESAREKERFHRILLDINSFLGISKILQLIVNTAIEFTVSQRAVLMILDKKKKNHQTAMAASEPIFSYSVKEPKANDIIWRTIKEKKPLLTKVNSFGFSADLSRKRKREARIVVSFPLMAEKEVMGVLMASSTFPPGFKKDDIQILSLLADQASIAISKARLIEDLRRAKTKLQNWTKELEQRVKKKTEQLQRSQNIIFQSEKLASIGQLAAGIAHEIRNPLGIIATSLYYLNEVLSDKEKDVEKHLRIIESEIDHCQLLINNLLEFSRKSENEVEVVDVNRLLNVTLSLVEKDLFTRDIRLIKKMMGMPKIRANLDEMKEVFLNLIMNATQAMPAGGELKVTTLVGKNNKVKVEIADTGVGIPRKNLSRIFDPFFTTKAPGEGTGLGLTLVHTIVERYKGVISVKSEEEKGTIFTLEFPISEV